MALFLKDNEPHVDLEISYALGRRVFNFSSTKFRVPIKLET
jgi:hypothetical protein